MKLKEIRKDARRVAFLGATAWDEEILNPWKNSYQAMWNAEGHAEAWAYEFFKEVDRLTKEATVNEG
jgi:hypothetical protein